jgi:hypothetical protein
VTAKFDAFKDELIALCDKHGVRLDASLFDSICVWDKMSDEEAISQDILEDRTE